MPAFNKHTVVSTPEIGIDPTYNPFNQNSGRGGAESRSTHAVAGATTNWELLYQNFEKNKQEAFENLSAVNGHQPSVGVELSPFESEGKEQGVLISTDLAPVMCVQLKGRYILSPVKSGLMIVDQHRAHVKVLYEQYMKQIDGKNITSQSVLFPDVLHLTSSQSLILRELLPEMEKIGFSLSALSGDDWSVNAVPYGMNNVNIKDILLDVIEAFTKGGDSISAKVYSHLALCVAQASALPYGKELSADEMDELLASLLRLSTPNYTPDGKNIFSILSNEQIEKMF